MHYTKILETSTFSAPPVMYNNFLAFSPTLSCESNYTEQQFFFTGDV